MWKSRNCDFGTFRYDAAVTIGSISWGSGVVSADDDIECKNVTSAVGPIFSVCNESALRYTAILCFIDK